MFASLSIFFSKNFNGWFRSPFIPVIHPFFRELFTTFLSSFSPPYCCHHSLNGNNIQPAHLRERFNVRSRSFKWFKLLWWLSILVRWMSARTVHLSSKFKKSWALFFHYFYMSLTWASCNGTCSSFIKFYPISALIVEKEWKTVCHRAMFRSNNQNAMKQVEQEP